MTKSPIYFPFGSEKKVKKQTKSRKWNRLFCRMVLTITIITFIWSIGSNALGKGMSCCIAGDGHPLGTKPPEKTLNKAKSSKSKKSEVCTYTTEVTADNNDIVDKLMKVYNKTECNKGSRPRTAIC